MSALAWMMHFPPRTMFDVPHRCAFLDTLFKVLDVWMYSAPLYGCTLSLMSCIAIDGKLLLGRSDCSMVDRYMRLRR